MNRSSYLTLRNLPILVLVVLVACGGGGGGGGNAPPTGDVPTATLTAPEDRNPGLFGTVAVTATASDKIAVTGVEFQIDGTALGAVATSAPYAVHLDTSLYTSGQHVLRARRATPRQRLRLVNGAGAVRRRVLQPSGFTQDEAWVTGLAGSTALAQAPDGRMFVTQQQGTIRVIKNGALLAAPFATMTVDSTGERGVLGIALHPDFANNGYVYVYSTRTDGGSHNRISRFTAAGDEAAAGSEITLVDLPNLSRPDPAQRRRDPLRQRRQALRRRRRQGRRALAQDLAAPFGKLLRFNEDGTIPTDNPFYATQSGVARAVWAYGLRNPSPSRCGPARAGSTSTTSVVTPEKRSTRRGRRNYGWPTAEGRAARRRLHGAAVHLPHSDPDPLGSGPGGFITGSAIVGGGTFYPSNGPFPAGYRDQYYFADFIGQFIGRLDAANGNAVYTFARLSAQPVDLLVGIDGALYVLTRGGITRISAP
jgi:glucose/arabinose dehydrogenase